MQDAHAHFDRDSIENRGRRARVIPMLCGYAGVCRVVVCVLDSAVMWRFLYMGSWKWRCVCCADAVLELHSNRITTRRVPFWRLDVRERCFDMLLRAIVRDRIEHIRELFDMLIRTAFECAVRKHTCVFTVLTVFWILCYCVNFRCATIRMITRLSRGRSTGIVFKSDHQAMYTF